MELIRYLRRASRLFGPALIAAALVAGVANTGLLAIIDAAIRQPAGTAPQWEVVVAFGVVLVLLLGTTRIMHGLLIRLTQDIIVKIRLNILDQLRRCPYRSYEQIGHERIYAALTKDTAMVGNLGPNLVYAMTSGVTVLVCFGYAAYLSWVAFVAALGVTVLAVALYMVRERPISRKMEAGRLKENDFFKYLDQLLKGFKELKMDRQRNDDLYDNHIRMVVEETRELTQRAFIGYVANGVTATAFFFLLIGFVLFVFPMLGGTHAAATASVAIIILYMYGPIEGLVNVVPLFSTAAISFQRLEELELEIARLGRVAEVGDVAAPEGGGFEGLEMRGVGFEYKDGEGQVLFKLGPMDFSLRAGETVFVVGGNGSGKSTFIRLLTGLYAPTEGEILLNGKVMDTKSYQGFRGMVAPIFSDYFLFDRFYGRRDVDAGRVVALLRQMELEGKVSYADGRFSTLDLSTGQRKRLAMVAALLDDKPIYIFDEWAADQDPGFRRYFYEGLLGELKARGKTVLAVTHDDRYFGVADRVVKMGEGGVV